MVTATKKRKTRVARKREPVLEVPAVKEPVSETPVVEKCFYCRESKYEPSTTRCPVITHTQKSL